LKGIAMQDKGKAGAKGKDIWKLVLFAAVVLSLIVLARVFGLGERLQELREWIAGMGTRGMVVFVGLYVVAVVAAVPGLPISIAGAAIFGALKGVILVSIGSTLGASSAFLISRYLARDAVGRWLSGNETFRRLDRLTEQHGAVIVAITRLVPLFPFNLLNYGYGLTRIPFWTYAFWSWLCMLPGTIVYLVGTDALVTAAATGDVPWLIVGVFVVALAFVILAVRIAGRKLKEKERAGERERK
jgi:uncharacterized membrane protein YdjX (TVP38/TMEM64 family)